MELNGKIQYPIVASNETAASGAENLTGSHLAESRLLRAPDMEARGDSMDRSTRDFLATHDDQLNVDDTARLLEINRSVQQSMVVLGTYLGAMGALRDIGRKLHAAEVGQIIEWVQDATGCTGPDAPDGSILHLELVRLMRGERFRTHSTTDIAVAMTLEANGRSLFSDQVIQYYVDSTKTVVSTPGAVELPAGVPPTQQAALEPLLTSDLHLALAGLLAHSAVVDISTQVTRP